jgi:4-alpha-glucanotransferase
MKNTQPDSPQYAHIRKTYFVQYHLHTQLLQVSQYAHQKGVALKCDIPVGVYRDSVETWTNPTLFNMEMQMGTPPSRDELMGQNWGFPPMRDTAEAIAFQHELLLYWQQFFDVARLDHVVSHFRIWEIPRTQLFADMGHYMPALSMSEEEIGRCGLAFRRELFTRPFINDHILEKLFGVHAPYVRETFLQKKAYHLYDLREEYDTQVKVQRFFEGRNDENSQWIRDGLYRLIANVLFLEDPYQPEMYHPRYGVFNAPVFDILTAEEKNAFMTLYNDYFFLRHNDFWRHRASRRFDKLLEDVRMLVCAEDLGLLPDCVHEVLDEQRMLTLEVQRMPKDSEVEFARLSAYPYRSVATISTHDMAPLRQWWEEFPGRTQRYFATMMQKEGRAPKHLPAHLAEELIARHLYGPSMMCILSLQDWLAMSADLRRKDPWSERINAPFDPYNQWKYRMHLTLEQLMTAQQYNGKVRQMIERSKRL